MICDRYYYSILTLNEKRIYIKMYKCFASFEKRAFFDKVSIQNIDLSKIYRYILLDNQWFYYVDLNGYTILESIFGKTIEFNYLYTREETEKLNAKIIFNIKKISQRISGKSEYEIEKSIYDLVVNNIEYDNEALNNHDKYALRSNTILGPIFFKKGVCEGISSIIKLLLNEFDIKCIIAYGKTNESENMHAWNIVKIDGKNYHIDATWDLTCKDSIQTYNHFNLSDSEIIKSHYGNIKYPVCNDDEYNYYKKNDLIAFGYDDIDRIINRAKSNNHNYVNIKIAFPVSIDNSLITYISSLIKEKISFIINYDLKTISISIK